MIKLAAHSSKGVGINLNIIEFGNGTAERHFDLYAEPVSNSTDLIVIYGSNIPAKFGGKFVRSNRMAPVHKQK